MACKLSDASANTLIEVIERAEWPGQYARTVRSVAHKARAGQVISDSESEFIINSLKYMSIPFRLIEGVATLQDELSGVECPVPPPPNPPTPTPCQIKRVEG